MKYLPLVLLIFTTTSFAAGFDCNKASTNVEKMICSSPNLSQKDDQLYELYNKAKSNQNKDAINKIRTWLKEDRNTCKTENCISEAYDDIFTTLKDSNTQQISSNNNNQKLKATENSSRVC